MWADGCTPNQVDFTDEAEAFWHCFVEKIEQDHLTFQERRSIKTCKNGRGNRQVWKERETKTKRGTVKQTTRMGKRGCIFETCACLSVSLTLRVEVYYKESASWLTWTQHGARPALCDTFTMSGVKVNLVIHSSSVICFILLYWYVVYQMHRSNVDMLFPPHFCHLLRHRVVEHTWSKTPPTNAHSLLLSFWLMKESVCHRECTANF